MVSHSINHASFESLARGGSIAREELIVLRLTSKLDLDSRQQKHIRAIVHETYSGILQVRNQSRPLIESLLEQGQLRIGAILRPDQQYKFRKIIAEHKACKSAEQP